SSILKIDPTTDTVSTFGSLASSGKFYSGVLAPNGMIYGLPFSSASILKIDPTTDTVSTFGSVGTSAGKWTGSVLAPNGMIYAIPYNSIKVLKISGVGTITPEMFTMPIPISTLGMSIYNRHQNKL